MSAIELAVGHWIRQFQQVLIDLSLNETQQVFGFQERSLQSRYKRFKLGLVGGQIVGLIVEIFDESGEFSI